MNLQQFYPWRNGISCFSWDVKIGARVAALFLPDAMLQSPLYIIDAFWDIEAGVWVATSNDVLGLATEAPTIEQLTQKLHIMIPELIQANQLLPEGYQGTIAHSPNHLRCTGFGY